MSRLFIITACLLVGIGAAGAASGGKVHHQIKSQKHPHKVTVSRTTRHHAKVRGGYDQNHGAYDPWYWDWSYGQ